MLAYVFWHRPRSGVERDAYEEAQSAFHDSLGIDSACFRLAALPFDEGAAYEDWYLVDDWEGLGVLNDTAVDERHRRGHDDAASLAAVGWGGVYGLVRGGPVIPEGAEWLEKPRGEGSAEFVASLPGDTVWRRQLVLGPAPEFCAGVSASRTRQRIWPNP